MEKKLLRVGMKVRPFGLVRDWHSLLCHKMDMPDMVADPDAAFSLSLYHPHVPRQNTSVFSLPRNNPKPSRTSSRMSQQKNFL
jgi:hypothetical protein